ncbi:alpha/beta fold hydrolase [Halosimplex pelagicum]|uniref:Alpha/beta fold hydrolase n=1 Tax=Halosimplex pelagicum TaxID=869886 RepID=A0A7D5TFW0_9EURY|nr:alpha/beta fold hydrolase [Halosimplex pelagicum]QLH80896.1 alpha/beta fold hydrolase [Halosimplex pelagicum]
MTATDASLLDLSAAESTRRTVNGVDLHVVTAGDPSNPMVVLLHGFPDFWYGWRHQVPALVDAGYYVVAPDQRGYNLSEKPRDLDDYRMRELSGDVAELIETENRDDAHVVGHDWGAAVAWDLALRHPDRVDHLGILNVPHPSVMRRTLMTNPRQLARSWYMFFFQLPVVPELVLGRDDARGVLDVLEGSANPGAFTDEELAHYRDAWRRQGAIRGAVNWYRALVRRRDDPPRETVAAPTLVVWGDEDAALLPSMATESVGHCTDGRLERIPWASHWVHDEEPERVNDALIGHLKGGSGN